MGEDVERLAASLQESVITALCFDDTEIVKALPVISVDLFEGIYGDIAERVLDYRARFGKAPNKSHIDDLFSDILGNREHKQHDTYNRLFVGMLEQYSNGFNVTYITSRVTEFARRQKLKQGVITAANRYSEGGDNVAQDVEQILLDAVNNHVKSLDPGTFLGDTQRALSFLDKDETEYIKTGIKELDDNGINPTKKQLFLYVAPTKTGKSWWLTHIGKMAILQGWRVAEATLEMSEELKCERYMQSLYSISRKDETFHRTIFKRDELGRFVSFDHQDQKAKMAFSNPSTRLRLEQKLQNSRWRNKLNRIVIKEFPSGALTIQDLNLWLDSLEQANGFVPDLLMVDYPALMSLGEARYHRLKLGQIMVDLRGMAVKRNMAVVAPHQVNREGIKSKLTRATHVSEDISSAFTCDNMITYSQTDAENKMGLARLFVDLARSERAKFTIIISQSYMSGQFFLDSMRIPDDYLSLVDVAAGAVEDDVDEEGDEDDRE